MKSHLGRGLLYTCFVFLNLAGQGYAQQQPAPPQAPPTPPAAPPPQEQRNTGDGAFSVELYYWLTSAEPSLRDGKLKSSTANTGNFDFPGHSKATPGIILSAPVGADNTLRLSYFQTKGSGDTTATQDLNVFNTDLSKGDFLATRYKLQNVKLSLDYLSFPFPVQNSKFRLKTLWEIQFTTIRSSIDGPLRAYQTDSSGNVISNTGEGTEWFFYPTFGLAVERSVSRNFRWEARASGFAVPHYSTIWDAEASAAYRIGRFEAIVGGKGFHFKTSPKHQQYLYSTLSGVYVGMRWYPSF